MMSAALYVLFSLIIILRNVKGRGGVMWEIHFLNAGQLKQELIKIGIELKKEMQRE